MHLEKEKSFTPIRVPAGQGVCKLTARHQNPVTSPAQQPHRSLQFFLILHPYRYARLCTIYPGGEGGGGKSKTPSPVCLISVNEIYNAKQKKEWGRRKVGSKANLCLWQSQIRGGRVGAQSHVRYLTALKSTRGPGGPI